MVFDPWLEVQRKKVPKGAGGRTLYVSEPGSGNLDDFRGQRTPGEIQIDAIRAEENQILDELWGDDEL